MNQNSNKPPIEQVMADLNKMFSNIGKNKNQQSQNKFGGNGNGGGNNTSFNSSDGWKSIAVILSAVLLFWGVLSSFYTVDVSEEGVVTRFKAYYKTTESGLHFKLPFGIDQVTKVRSKEILIEEFGFRSQNSQQNPTQYSKTNLSSESLMLTGDLNVADVEWIIQYKISDPWKFLFKARDVRTNIRDISISIMRRVVGDRPVSDVLTTGRVEIADQAKILTQEVLDRYDMGIKIKQIILQDVNPPQSVKSAFNEVNSAKQEQEETINKAERDYNSIIPEARGKAEREIADAMAYSTALLNKAQGDANKFKDVLIAYKEAPSVTRKRMYLETMEKIYGSAEKLIIVDPKIQGVLPIFQQQEKSTSIEKAVKGE